MRKSTALHLIKYTCAAQCTSGWSIHRGVTKVATHLLGLRDREPEDPEDLLLLEFPLEELEREREELEPELRDLEREGMAVRL